MSDLPLPKPTLPEPAKPPPSRAWEHENLEAAKEEFIAIGVPPGAFAPPPPDPRIRGGLVPQHEMPETWWDMYRDAFGYVLRGDGLGILAGVSVISAVPLLGDVFLFVVAGMGMPYVLSVIETTAAGKDRPPLWPDVHDLGESVWGPIMKFMTAGFVAALPLLAYLLWCKTQELAPSKLGVFVLLGWQVVYAPMAWLGLAMSESMEVLSPHRVIPNVLRTLPGYLAVLVVSIGVDAALSVSSVFAIVPLLGKAISLFVTLYCLVTLGRLLGMFQRRYNDQLEW